MGRDLVTRPSWLRSDLTIDHDLLLVWVMSEQPSSAPEVDVDAFARRFEERVLRHGAKVAATPDGYAVIRSMALVAYLDCVWGSEH